MLEDRANTPQEKREAIEAIFKVWLKYPELRLGQLIANVIASRPADDISEWCMYEFLLEDGIVTPRPKGYFNVNSRSFSDLFKIEDKLFIDKLKIF